MRAAREPPSPSAAAALLGASAAQAAAAGRAPAAPAAVGRLALPVLLDDPLKNIAHALALSARTHARQDVGYEHRVLAL